MAQCWCAVPLWILTLHPAKKATHPSCSSHVAFTSPHPVKSLLGKPIYVARFPALRYVCGHFYDSRTHSIHHTLLPVLRRRIIRGTMVARTMLSLSSLRNGYVISGFPTNEGMVSREQLGTARFLPRRHACCVFPATSQGAPGRVVVVLLTKPSCDETRQKNIFWTIQKKKKSGKRRTQKPKLCSKLPGAQLLSGRGEPFRHSHWS